VDEDEGVDWVGEFAMVSGTSVGLAGKVGLHLELQQAVARWHTLLLANMAAIHIVK
jgi:hypothetical protein